MEEWHFSYDTNEKSETGPSSPSQYQHVRQALWSPDERSILLHLSGTNHLHLLTRGKELERQRVLQEDCQDMLKEASKGNGESPDVGSSFGLSRVTAAMNLLAWRLRERVTSSFMYYTPLCPSLFDHQDLLYSLKIHSASPRTAQNDAYHPYSRSRAARLPEQGGDHLDAEYLLSDLAYETQSPDLILAIYTPIGPRRGLTPI